MTTKIMDTLGYTYMKNRRHRFDDDVKLMALIGSRNSYVTSGEIFLQPCLHLVLHSFPLLFFFSG